MNSILKKLVLLITVCVLSASIFIGALATLRFHGSMVASANERLNLTCSENAKSINMILDRMEKSVNILADYTVQNLYSNILLTNSTSLAEYERKLESLGRSIAEDRDGAVGLFVRFNPEYSNETAGFYLVKNSDDGAFEQHPKTPLTGNRSNTFDWYDIPKDSGNAVWIDPYVDAATGRTVISYVYPMYKQFGSEDPIFLGVAGIDVSFDFFTSLIDNIEVYDSGFAFLTGTDLRIIYSKETFDSGNPEPAALDITAVEKNEMVLRYRTSGREMRITFRLLDNGMCIAVTAPEIDVLGDVYMLIVEIVLITVCFVVIFLYIAFSVAKNIISPLGELNRAAIRVAEGDLDIDFDYDGKDEIGTLTQSLKTTVKELKKRISFTDSLAYHDSLTGLNNVTAYTRDRERFKIKLDSDYSDYAIFIIDINGLKTINDTFGHRVGNDLIISSGKAIGSTFGYENVYRIGGDEFVVIVHGANEQTCRALKDSLAKTLEDDDGKIKPALAIGYAVSNGNYEYEHVFELADEAMYSEKVQMKANGITSRVIK